MRTFLIDIVISLLTLTFLEIILGVDNLVFVSILSHRLPREKQKKARRIGLFFALIMRLLLLAAAVWVVHLTNPIFHLFEYQFSIRDLFLLAGGLFLMVKGTLEIHAEFEMAVQKSQVKSAFFFVILQIVFFDLIFSFDTILTAVGLTNHYWIMATAITIAIILMILASDLLSEFIQQNPTIKMLALSFLLLIGMVLIADAFHYHISRAYVYFAICFSIFVEFLNILLAKKKKKRVPPSLRQSRD